MMNSNEFKTEVATMIAKLKEREKSNEYIRGVVVGMFTAYKVLVNKNTEDIAETFFEMLDEI